MMADENKDDEEKRGPGRPRKELPEIGDNIKSIEDDIRSAVDKITKFGKDRDAINQKVQAVREDLYAKGIPKEAFDLARNYVNWPEDKRKAFDLAYAICREAVGAPLQRDLFDRLDGK